jgi:hypothetical protein
MASTAQGDSDCPVCAEAITTLGLILTGKCREAGKGRRPPHALPADRAPRSSAAGWMRWRKSTACQRAARRSSCRIDPGFHPTSPETGAKWPIRIHRAVAADGLEIVGRGGRQRPDHAAALAVEQLPAAVTEACSGPSGTQFAVCSSLHALMACAASVNRFDPDRRIVEPRGRA